MDLTVSEIDKAIYVVYPDETGGNWRVQAIAVSSDSFESRKALPEPWRGLRDEALSEVTQIPGGIFVHASGFIGGKSPPLLVKIFLNLPQGTKRRKGLWSSPVARSLGKPEREAGYYHTHVPKQPCILFV